MNDGIAKNQHYVPQFLLKNFTYNGQKINVFSKRDGRIFSSNTKNVASENGFYNFTVEESGDEHTWEVALSNLEGRASEIIKKVILDKSFNNLSDDEKWWMAFFMAVQMVRTRGARDYFKDMIIKISGEISSRLGGEGTQLLDELEGMISDESLKRYTAESLNDVKENYLSHFLSKHWALYEAPKGESFYIGDNPVSMSNYLPGKFGGSNVGLAVKGVEIYLPISSKLSIVLLCPEHIHDMTSFLKKRKALGGLSVEMKESLSETEELLLGVLSGNALEINQENIIHCNSLQVMYSNRYVFSSMKNFSLAIEMIMDNDKYREGLKGTVS